MARITTDHYETVPLIFMQAMATELPDFTVWLYDDPRGGTTNSDCVVAGYVLYADTDGVAIGASREPIGEFTGEDVFVAWDAIELIDI